MVVTFPAATTQWEKRNSAREIQGLDAANFILEMSD